MSHSRRRIGATTGRAEECRSVDDLITLLREQVSYVVSLLLEDCRAVEEANARFHPSPLTSMLVDGCMEKMRDAASGGARYNGSGIQGVGVVEVGDSLAAVNAVLGQSGISMTDIVRACRNDFTGDEELQS